MSEMQSPFPPKDFDQFLRTAMSQWQVPGMGLAIVKDDVVIHARGYGVKDIGNDEPVDEHTVFAVGSVTKSFTATALAALVSEGKVSWDDRVAQYLPDFQHPDPWVTRELTLRDMLSHRTGLPRGVHILLRGLYDLDAYLHRVRYLEPVASFRSGFHYTNTTFEAVGKMFPTMAGMNWEDFVQQRIFDPLGMTASSTNVEALGNIENLSTPHAKIDGVVQPVARCNIGYDASGSINSNAVDMAQWIRLLFNKGAYQGEQLISTAAVNEMHAPQIVIPLEHPDVAPLRALGLDTNFSSYGLGWVVIDYRGKKMVFHPGGIQGYAAMTAALPGENLGVVILTNMHEAVAGPFLYALTFGIFDAYLGGPQRDWSADVLQAIRQMEEMEAAAWQKVVEAQAEGTSPSLPLARYTGAYAESFCGEARVTEEDGALVLHYGPTSKADLAHWHYDTFRATWRNPMFQPEFVTFALDKTGEVDTMNVESMAVFERESSL